MTSQEAQDVLRRGMRDDQGIVHAAGDTTAQQVHAGWWVPACALTGFGRREAMHRNRGTEDPTTCIWCAASGRNARIHR